MRHQPPTEPTVTYTPLTELEQIAGEPLRAKTRSGQEVLFGQIQMSDLGAFEREVGPVGLLGDPSQRVTGWHFLCLRSLQHHNPKAAAADVDALFPANARGIARMGEVVGAVLPPQEDVEDPAEEAEPPKPQTGRGRSSRSASGSGGPSTT